MSNVNIKLETRLVGEITGEFIVPSYQRGYRWGKNEIVRLLEDITASGRNKMYYLQPIVLKRLEDGKYELIDGQQRLTSLYLIMIYLNVFSNGFLPKAKYSIEYITRCKSANYLKNIFNSDDKDANIDFWFMGNAYEAISEWAKQQSQAVLTELNYLLENCVRVIWYEVDSTEDAINLFTRLNIGKIPLTSSELIKAMFLSEHENLPNNRKEEIALQWDHMEKELHNDELWYFLTNNNFDKYQTRIDLVMDLIAGKEIQEIDQYYTYFFFDKLRKIGEGKRHLEDLKCGEYSYNNIILDEIEIVLRENNSFGLIDIWQEIQHTFLILKDWYRDHDFYHKIGYLICTRTKTLKDIYTMSLGKTKSQFKNELDEAIALSIKVKKDYSDLSYDSSSDAKAIYKILLLFNVESIRQLDEHTRRFPFYRLKARANGKGNWSLEHIHAQQSQGMRSEADWKEWLKLHIPSLKSIGNHEELLEKMQNLLDRNALSRNDFEEVQRQVVELLSENGSEEYKHSLANLALLHTCDNSALNNSTFDVKRNMIIEMDKEGKYIPFCTKMVFLKYYTPSESNQLHFWGKSDRDAYISAMNKTLSPYLTRLNTTIEF